jgi:peptidoglycan/LPS O-acetylase OafA/YrhL
MDKSAYRLDIQGLRAVAVLAVMLFHYDGTLLPGGYIGVDIFLVISGYLITQQIQSRKSAGRTAPAGFLGRFYFGRIKRIVPAYFFMLATVAVLAKLLFTNSDFAYFVASLKSTALFVSNNYFASFGDYFAPGTAEQPLLHTWSLAVEMQFYMFLPILLLIVPDRHIKRSILIISIALVLAAEWQLRVAGHRQATYYALYSRIPEFLAGSWLAIAATGRDWSIIRANIAFLAGALLIVFSLFALDGASLFPGLLSVPAVAGAGLIISARHSSLSAALRNPVMVWIGFLSYSLYLWHWPVLALIRYYTGALSLGSQGTLLFVLATLLLACISFYLVEEPARKLRLSTFTRRRLMVALLIAGVGSLGAYRAAIAAKAYFSTSGLPIEYTRYADPATICHGMDNGRCQKGDLDSAREILVIGDSHAAMLNGFFDQLGHEEGFRATVMTASSCVPIPGFNVAKLPEWARQSCLDQIQRVEALASTAEVLFIAGMWSYQVEDPSFAPALTRFLQAMGDGHRVYVLSQVPELSKNPMRMHRFAGLGLPHHVSFNEAYLQANQAIARAAEQGGAKFVGLDQLDLFRSAPYLDGRLIYMDESHLNQIGVEAYAHQAKMRIHELVMSNER